MSKKRIKKYSKVLKKSKQKIQKRLERKQFEDQLEPIMAGSNIHYEMSEKVGAISCGGIGAFHQLVKRVGLDKKTWGSGLVICNIKLKLIKLIYGKTAKDRI